MASRAALAFSIATFGAIEGFILSIPAAYAMGQSHAPKGEFAGLAVFGTILVTGAASALVVFTALLILVLTRYREELARRLTNVLGTLMAAVASAIVIGYLLAKFGGAMLWSIVISAVVLTIGLAISFRQPEPE